MYMAGRALQMVGLVLAPIALIQALDGGSGQGVAQRELMMLAVAAGEDVAGAPDPAARQALCRNPLDALQPDDLKGDLLVRLLDQ